MTKDVVRKRVREILTHYLELNNHRKTPERYAILDAVYTMNRHFTLDELDKTLQKSNFRVSRATLYNTMKLFIKLRLVIRHRFMSQTVYEGCYDNEQHIHQICTICGKVTEVNVPAIQQAIESTKLYRFRKDGFTLYIYGVCSSCQRRISLQRNSQKQQ